jgi:formylglycine-generating enzyme required for sulfatase activity
MTLWVMVVVLSVANVALADTFGTGDNQFTVDFVDISGDTNPASGYGIVNNDYRMGTYEITNGQWDKFVNSYGTVTGSPSAAYDRSVYYTGTDVPANMVSWYETAQFINYLNTSTDHTAAYKFTGTQGTSGYTLGVWESGDAGYDSTNPYRNSNAFYFLPTDDEWVKAAYWNGTSLQTYATKAGESLSQGDGTSGTGWNFYNGVGYATDPYGPWDVGSGAEELNGTFDMMGNVWEWMESPGSSGDYLSGSDRAYHGGGYFDSAGYLKSSYRGDIHPSYESWSMGFRVASVPEPCSLVLLSVGGLMLRRKYKR